MPYVWQSYDVVEVSYDGKSWDNYVTIRTLADANAAIRLVNGSTDAIRYRIVRQQMGKFVVLG